MLGQRTMICALALAVAGFAAYGPSAIAKDRKDEAKAETVAAAPDKTETTAKTDAAKAPAEAAKMAAAPKINREAFEKWELECYDPAVNGLKCQVAQKLVATDSKQLVLVLSLAYSPTTKQHVLQLALPLNFMLKPGVEIEIGTAKTVAQVDRCSSQGCFIEGIAAQDLIDAMLKGETGNVKFLAAPEKRVVIPFGLNGFTKAYDKMKSNNSAS